MEHPGGQDQGRGQFQDQEWLHDGQLPVAQGGGLEQEAGGDGEHAAEPRGLVRQAPDQPRAQVLLPGHLAVRLALQHRRWAEEAALRRSEITWLAPAQARDPGAITAALQVLAGQADVVHFHVDLDVYDPSIAPANSYAAPDGLLAHDVRRIVCQTAGHLPVV